MRPSGSAVKNVSRQPLVGRCPRFSSSSCACSGVCAAVCVRVSVFGFTWQELERAACLGRVVVGLVFSKNSKYTRGRGSSRRPRITNKTAQRKITACIQAAKKMVHARGGAAGSTHSRQQSKQMRMYTISISIITQVVVGGASAGPDATRRYAERIINYSFSRNAGLLR